MSRNDWDAGDEAASAILGIAIAAVAFLFIVALAALVGLVAELHRIFTTTGAVSGSAARTLWLSLLGVVVLLGGCTVVALAVPGALGGALVVSTVGIGAFVIVAEVCDQVSQAQQTQEPALDDLSTFLYWEPTSLGGADHCREEECKL